MLQGLCRRLDVPFGRMIPLQIQVCRPFDQALGAGFGHQRLILFQGLELHEKGAEEVVEEDVPHGTCQRFRPLLFLLLPLGGGVEQLLSDCKLVAGRLRLQK